MSEEECLQELERRLAEAVRMRLISDVPLGALLSGGVDSSIVVALMARASTSPVKTFSIGFRADEFDESGYARVVAEHFGTEHQELVVEPNMEETLQFLSAMLEEPFGDSSMLPTYYVCRMARQQVTVALSGDGGDELFAGYDRYQVAMSIVTSIMCRTGWGALYRRRCTTACPQARTARTGRGMRRFSARERYLDDISILPALHREKNLFTRGFSAGFRGASRTRLGQFRRYYDDAPASDALSRLLYLDTKTYLAGDILTKVDRMSMAASLEVRVPMLDHEFVEWVAGITHRVEVTQRNAKVPAEEAGGAAGDSICVAASAETGVCTAFGAVDEERTQTAVAVRIAGAAELAARVLQAGRGAHIAIRTFARPP